MNKTASEINRERIQGLSDIISSQIKQLDTVKQTLEYIQSQIIKESDLTGYKSYPNNTYLRSGKSYRLYSGEETGPLTWVAVSAEDTLPWLAPKRMIYYSRDGLCVFCDKTHPNNIDPSRINRE